MFEMTTNAVCLAPSHIECTRMISALFLDPLGDFGMAFQALEATLSQSEVVASGALSGTFQILMGPG